MRNKKLSLALVAAAAAIGLMLAAPAAWTQGGGGKGGAGAGAQTDRGKGAGKGSAGAARGGGHQSLRDVFQEMVDESRAEDKGPPAGKGKPTTTGAKPSDKGKSAPTTAAKGKKPTTTADEDSDKPAWAGTKGPAGRPGGGGGVTPGVKKGDLYGDLYIIVRDEDGVPVLDANGYVQVYYVDASGKLVCCIPRDSEGELLATLPNGTAVAPIEVELGRLSVGRSPTTVLSAQYEDAITTINEAVSVALDAAGRIVVTLADGTTKTIDSPLQNLALYVELLNTGTLTGVDPTKLSSLSYLVDGQLTADDLEAAAAFFAAASDKTVPVTLDAIIYMNSILKIDGTLAGDYVDYSSFDYTYDRAASYSALTIEVLVLKDGVWVPTTVNVYEAVFGSTPLTAEDAAGVAAATDDARAIINFIHEYEVPAASL